ncbi:MAG: Polyhydroxyalkanoic acid synthase [Pseudomonadota bacterium]
MPVNPKGHSVKRPAAKSSSKKTTKAKAGAARSARSADSEKPVPGGVGRSARPAQGEQARRADKPGHSEQARQGARPGQGERPGESTGVHIPPEVFSQLQTEYLNRLTDVFSGATPPRTTDRRFAGDAWSGTPFAWGAALYSLNAEYLQKMADAVTGDRKSRDRIRFAMQQWVDMMSPANFLLTNPDAQQRLIETRGESLRAGITNMLNDLQRGRISQTDEAAFEVGRNVATTPGAVVFENELIQLIQYEPGTAQVGSRPLLMVPPCINKFYIMDLQPDNSLVNYAVSQGHTAFMVSWRNVHADQSHLTWDDYLEKGLFEAIRVVLEISGQPTINLLGFCVGGTLTATAAAALAAKGKHCIESLTLLTTMLDFEDPGVLGVFIDDAFVAFKDSTIGSGGLMPGRDLATTFNFLRPNDLVWNYVVSSYLKGEAPPAFDLLYWNADSTNLPGPMYCWYIRHMYLQNQLREPGRLVCSGVPIDLGRIGVPTYLYASREDHIVPWRSAWASTRLLSGPLRFVLGASGHIAGVINPASKNKRNYWSGDLGAPTADAWLDSAQEIPGSWWPDWANWLAQYRGRLQAAPRSSGSRQYRAIEPAPGRYVKEKA